MKKKGINKIFWLGLFLLSTFLSLHFFSLKNQKTPIQDNKPKQVADFRLIVLPDTQAYSRDYPEILTGQTQWIVNRQKIDRIVFVSQLGDLTDSWNNQVEWENVNLALSLLDKVVPYGLLPGNHDDPKLFNQYFSYQRYKNESWWGGYFEADKSNSYQFFSAEGLEFIIFHLKYNPTKAVLDWADQLLEKYSSYRAIIVSHDILDYDGFRSPIGERIFKALADNQNVFLMLSGHAHVENSRADLVEGRPIYQLLADYQDRSNGGNGWLRILKFVPKENKIYIQTYSPNLNQYEVDENSQFELDYSM